MLVCVYACFVCASSIHPSLLRAYIHGGIHMCELTIFSFFLFFFLVYDNQAEEVSVLLGERSCNADFIGACLGA